MMDIFVDSKLCEPDRIVLREEATAQDSRYLDARYSMSGSLVISGQDLGRGVMEALQCQEYECRTGSRLSGYGRSLPHWEFGKIFSAHSDGRGSSAPELLRAGLNAAVDALRGLMAEHDKLQRKQTVEAARTLDALGCALMPAHRPVEAEAGHADALQRYAGVLTAERG